MIENRPQIPSQKELLIQQMVVSVLLTVEFPVMWLRGRLIEDHEMNAFLDRNKKVRSHQN